MAVAAPFIAMTLAAIGGGMSAQAQRNAGIAERQQNTAQRRQEGDAARQREILRRQDLLRALANQNAVAGAQGVRVVGSAAAIAARDIRDAHNDLLTDRVNTQRSAGILRAAGRNAVTTGNVAANASLLDSASRAASSFGGGYGKGSSGGGSR